MSDRLHDAMADLLAGEPPMDLSVPEVVHSGQRRRARRRRLAASVAAGLVLVLGGAVGYAVRPAGRHTATPAASSPPSAAADPSASPSAARVTGPAANGSTPPQPSQSGAGGFALGSGPSAMVFPERPGLTVPKSALTPYAGPAVVTGTYRQSNCVVTTQIRVAAGGRLSLSNCWIRVNVSDDGTGMIGKAGYIELTHVLVDGSGHGGATMPVRLAGGGKVTFSEFVGTTQNVQVDSPAEVSWNYVHGPKQHTPGGGARSYGFAASSAGGPVTFAHNWIDMTGAEGLGAAVYVASDNGSVEGLRIEDNTLRPGGPYSLYVRTDGACRCGTIRDVRVVDNRWYGDADHVWGGTYGAFSVNDTAVVTAWSGNTLTKPGAARPIPLTLDVTNP